MCLIRVLGPMITALVWTVGLSAPSLADSSHENSGDSQTIGAEVGTTNGMSGATGGPSSGGGGMTLEELLATCRSGGDAAPATSGCPAGYILALAGAEADAPTLVVAASLVALNAREQVTVTAPRPHLSPDGVPQVTGLRTWFWLDPAAWQAQTVRAEIPGLWAEVTAAPTHTQWDPGDGAPPLTCNGPGRPHPGTTDATTDCGHVYEVVGAYTLTVTITYAVTWRSSTGETGTQDPFVLSADLPVTVTQRQVVLS